MNGVIIALNRHSGFAGINSLGYRVFQSHTVYLHPHSFMHVWVRHLTTPLCPVYPFAHLATRPSPFLGPAVPRAPPVGHAGLPAPLTLLSVLMSRGCTLMLSLTTDTALAGAAERMA